MTDIAIDWKRGLARIEAELSLIETVPVYFAQAQRNGEIKIGFSTGVGNRLYMLGHHKMTRVKLLGWVQGGPRVEREMHAKFESFALGHEWFKPAPALLAFIESSTRHDDPDDIDLPFAGRVTDWGFDSLLADERLYREMANPNPQ